MAGRVSAARVRFLGCCGPGRLVSVGAVARRTGATPWLLGSSADGDGQVERASAERLLRKAGFTEVDRLCCFTRGPGAQTTDPRTRQAEGWPHPLSAQV